MMTFGKGDLDAVSLDLVRRYLRTQGWRSPDRIEARKVEAFHGAPIYKDEIMDGRTGGSRTFEVFILPEEGSENVELLLPVNGKGIDYYKRMDGVVRTLSELEDRNPEEIVFSIRSIGADVMKSRVPDEFVEDDSIHLLKAMNYISKMKDLLSATATTEIRPDPFFFRVKKEGVEYADHCRFGLRSGEALASPWNRQFHLTSRRSLTWNLAHHSRGVLYSGSRWG